MYIVPDPAPAIALVTGAGRGLGRALALELTQRGMTVAALGRNLVDLNALVDEAPAGRILPLVADVADPIALTAAFNEIDYRLGPLDTLINNAAVYPHRDFLAETPASFAATMSVNLGGTATCAMLALERMVQTGRGRILNVTSLADIRPTHLSSAYSVSKGACRILTRAMVVDLADRFPDIVINEWIPGVLNTDMGLAEGNDPKLAARWGAALALWRDPAITGATFIEDREQLSVLSWKRRLFNRVTGQHQLPRVVRV
jgi:NAD(P)-dependent dehydrogenase (short-subunit alcohol dehydrogenase family)